MMNFNFAEKYVVTSDVVPEKQIKRASALCLNTRKRFAFSGLNTYVIDGYFINKVNYKENNTWKQNITSIYY